MSSLLILSPSSCNIQGYTMPKQWTCSFSIFPVLAWRPTQSLQPSSTVFPGYYQWIASNAEQSSFELTLIQDAGIPGSGFTSYAIMSDPWDFFKRTCFCFKIPLKFPNTIYFVITSFSSFLPSYFPSFLFIFTVSNSCFRYMRLINNTRHFVVIFWLQ